MSRCKIWRDPQPRTLVLGLAATTLAAFTFLTTMHERYAYGALVFLMLLIPEARVRWLGLAFGVVFTLNLVAAIPATEELGRLLPVWGPLGLVGSVVMVVLTALTLYQLDAHAPKAAPDAAASRMARRLSFQRFDPAATPDSALDPGSGVHRRVVRRDARLGPSFVHGMWMSRTRTPGSTR